MEKKFKKETGILSPTILHNENRKNQIEELFAFEYQVANQENLKRMPKTENYEKFNTTIVFPTK